MTTDEIKRRRMAGQYLIRPGERHTVLSDLLGFQAQIMKNALHAMELRCIGGADGEGLCKSWTIRGTVHIFNEADLPLYKHDGGAPYRSQGWNGAGHRSTGEWMLTPERQAYFSTCILDALALRPQTRDELKAMCRNRGMTEEEEACLFDQWGGGIRDLCERGFCAYTVEETKRFMLAPLYTPMAEADARREMARRYFSNFGPVTLRDAAYYFGTSQANVKIWMRDLPIEAVDCAGKTYYHIPNTRLDDGDIPSCVLLAGFDQLLLGYRKEDSLFLPTEHLRGIFNLAGIVMPAVLLDGRVVAKWGEKKGRVTVMPFEPLSDEKCRMIAEAAEKQVRGMKDLRWDTGRDACNL